MDETPLEIVQTDDALAAVVQRLAHQPVLGIDTESDSMYHYQEKICLLQISDSLGDIVIDPLAVRDLSALGPIFANPAQVKVFHGADYDVVCLNRDYGFRIHNLFDTMISAQILGLPRCGLADLVDRYFSVTLDKRYQKHDWAERPLRAEHLEYARGDTHFLSALRELFLLRLGQAGRLDVAEEEFEILSRREWTGRRADPDGWVRMKRIGGLDADALRTLRHLYRYREAQAQSLDRPPYKVLPDQVLQVVAERRPADLDSLKVILRPGSSMVRRHGDALVRAVRDARQDVDPLPEPGRKAEPEGPRAPYRGRDAERLFLRLKAWRTEVVERRGVPVAMVASNTQLKQLAASQPTTEEALREVPDVRGWQIARYANEWLELIQAHRGERGREAAAPAAGGGGSKRRRRRRRSGADGA